MAAKRGNFTLANFEPVCAPRLDADAARRAGLRAVEDRAGPGRRRQGQSRQDHLRERRARDLAAYRDRGAEPGHQDRHQLRAVWRLRARDQRADGRTRAGGVGRLSNRGIADQGGTLCARWSRRSPQAHPGARRRADADRDRIAQIRGRDLLRRRGAGQDPARRAEEPLRDAEQGRGHAGDRSRKYAQQACSRTAAAATSFGSFLRDIVDRLRAHHHGGGRSSRTERRLRQRPALPDRTYRH